MNRKRIRRRLCVALCVCAVATHAAENAGAAIITSNILLGPGSFSASVSGGPGSSLQIGNVAGNYKAVFVNSSISASNQTASLTLSPTSISASNANGSANLSYDDVTPGTPVQLNSFNANFSPTTSTGVSIAASPISVKIGSLGNFPLTLNFSGSLSNVTFTSDGTPVPDSGAYSINGTYGVTLGGSVTGTLNTPIGNIGLGTLYNLPATVVTFAGAIDGNTVLSDTGVPYGSSPSDANKNNMLANFNAALGSTQIPFSFSAPVNTSISNSVGTFGTGITTLNITGSTLNANVVLSNLSYNLSGTVNGVLVPEPSSLLLAGIGLIGLLGLARKRRQRAA